MRLKSDEVLVLCGDCEGVSADRKASILKKFRSIQMIDESGRLTDRGQHVCTSLKFEKKKTPEPPKKKKKKKKKDDSEGGEGGEGKSKPKPESEMTDGNLDRSQGTELDD
tara:strand:- start:1029 stop:1358 length:330 start_codon:yes stop_codon:yes gene_type:complete